VTLPGSSVADMGVDSATPPRWAVQTSGTTSDLFGLWAQDGGSEVYAVGAGGIILHTSDGGQNWSKRMSGVNADLFGVWGTANLFIAVGAGGTVLTSGDGFAWSAQQVGPGKSLLKVWGSSNSDAFAVGESGTIMHFAGGAWGAA